MKCMGYGKDEIINCVNYYFSLFLFLIKLNFFCKHIFTGVFASVTLLVVNFAPCSIKQVAP